MADAILNEVHVSHMFDLRGVVAVVTGGGSGIGLMMSTTLVSNGATVFIIGPAQKDLDRIANVYNEAAEKLGKPGRMYGIEGDISEKSEALRLADEVGKRVPHVTVLFNNAGTSGGHYVPPPSPTAAAFQATHLSAASQSDFDTVFHTNATGPFWLTLAFLPLLEKWTESGCRGAGGKAFAPQVVMTSSMNGWTKDPATGAHSFPYLFSKSALAHATAALAHELLPLGVRVNGIAPGFFLTELTAPGSADALGTAAPPPPARAPPFAVPCAQPPPADGTPPIAAGSRTDMGALVLFLVSNWFVNGATVLIDGGTFLVHANSF